MVLENKFITTLSIGFVVNVLLLSTIATAASTTALLFFQGVCEMNEVEPVHAAVEP